MSALALVGISMTRFINAPLAHALAQTVTTGKQGALVRNTRRAAMRWSCMLNAFEDMLRQLFNVVRDVRADAHGVALKTGFSTHLHG